MYKPIAYTLVHILGSLTLKSDITVTSHCASDIDMGSLLEHK